MSDITLYDIARWIKRWVWRPFTSASSAMHFLPVVTALVLALLFAYVDQLREIYYATVEMVLDRGPLWRLLPAFVALVLLSGALYLSNYHLVSQRLDELYNGSGNPDTDWRLRSLRNTVGIAVAFLPWFGIALGCEMARGAAAETIQRLSTIAGSDEIEATKLGFAALMPGLRIAAILVAILGSAVAWGLHLARKTRIARRSVVASIVLVISSLILLPLLVHSLHDRAAVSMAMMPTHETAVALFRWLGPLAMITLAATALYVVVAGMAYLSSQIGFPVITVTVVAGLVTVMMGWSMTGYAWFASVAFGLVVILAVFSQQWSLVGLSLILAILSVAYARQVEDPNAKPLAVAAPAREQAGLETQFRQWLDARQQERAAYAATGRHYPVFIVTAPGGGIYAAAAAEAFLSHMTERCDTFPQHVFAISAVSGGAVGATLYQTSIADREIKRAGCRIAKPAAERASRQVVLDDHLSPLLGFLPADLFGAYSDRSEALEQSFISSARTHRLAGNLGAAFADHWKAGEAPPALLLNSTWVETGQRVVFAPFLLSGISDGTLLSFRDRLGTDPPKTTVARAAVVSARFPGTVPAYSLVVGAQGDVLKRRWHFVDGGYADSSGSSTALDLFVALKALVERERLDVDLRLVLLASPDLDKEPDAPQGTAARDTLAPVIALVKVRDLLSRQAIRRALAAAPATMPTQKPAGGVDDASPGSPCAATKPDARNARDGCRDGWQVARVELDADSLRLALGWKISRATHRLVSLLMAPPQKCGETGSTMAAPGSRGGESLGISSASVSGNSCVIDALAKLLTL